MDHRKVIILGSGPAGFTAAIYTARANLSPLVLHGPTPHGQLSWTTEVENFPGFPEGVQGPELMELMERQAKRFGAECIQETISQVDFSRRPYTLKGSTKQFTCDALIVATGATPKKLSIPGEMELMGYGVSTCATCDGAFFHDKEIVVIGGGDSACEEALFLTRFGRRVSLVHRRSELRASKIMQERVLNHPKITPLLNRVPLEIEGSRDQGVSSLVVQDAESKEKSRIVADGIFIAIGHSPNTSLFINSLAVDENNYLVTHPRSTRTEIEGVFACGDVQDHTYRQAITAAGSGCMAALEAERFLEHLGK
jgi:thioredoxin reductase (NADPH)